MEIGKAKHLANEYAVTIMSSTYAEAIDTLIKHITELENKLNNKEKVIVIDQEELILRLTNLKKGLESRRKSKEIEFVKTGLTTTKKLVRKELEEIDTKQQTYTEIINLIKEL